MNTEIAPDLSKKERDAFVSVMDTGLWDVLLASYTTIFAVAPLLSGTLGDFWSSVVFIPFWIAVFLAVSAVRKNVVIPRVGQVRWSVSRQQRLKTTTWAMLAVNALVFVIGLVALLNYQPDSSSQWAYPTMLSLALLVLLSIGAYALSIPRFYFYAILMAICPAVGEYLFQAGLASHHGFPIVFGFASIAIACVGLLKLARIMKLNPAMIETTDQGENRVRPANNNG